MLPFLCMEVAFGVLDLPACVKLNKKVQKDTCETKNMQICHTYTSGKRKYA